MDVSHQGIREHLAEPTGRTGRSKNTHPFSFFIPDIL